MSAKLVQKSRYDTVKWLLAVALVIVGLWANAHYHQAEWAVKVGLGLGISALAITLAALTAKGRRFWQFSKEAQIELHKVTWPTRSETLKITLGIVALVTAMALILWAIDSMLFWVIGSLT